MGFILLLIMIAVPIGEIAVFIEAGDQFGLWPTLGAVILTAIIGTAFLRHQGLGVLRRVQESMNRGEAPVREMFDGLCLLIAGALLLTPGFITDGVGFALLVSPFRRAMAGLIVAHLMKSGRATTWSAGPGGGPSAGMHGFGQGPGHSGMGPGGPVIDGEFEDVSPDRGGDTEDDKNDTGANPRIGP